MMKKDDYRTEFEVNRQEIDLNDENNNGKIQSRTELHSKARKQKKTSVHRLINILLVLFTLIPIGILIFVISNWYSPGDDLSPKVEDSQFHVETSKNTSEKKPDSSDKVDAVDEEEEAEELKKQELEKEELAKKEREEKEKIAKQKQEEQAKQEEQVKKEEEERVKKEQAEQAKKVQEEQAKKEREEQAKKETEKPAARSHTVAAGETLYRISVNYYNSGDGVSKIMAANGLTSNEIVKGQKLIIP